MDKMTRDHHLHEFLAFTTSIKTAGRLIPRLGSHGAYLLAIILRDQHAWIEYSVGVKMVGQCP